MITTVKVFKSGSGQAVRLPNKFRFDSEDICAKRIGSAVLLFPRKAAWHLMGQAIGNTDSDFMVERAQPKQTDIRKPLTTSRGKSP